MSARGWWRQVRFRGRRVGRRPEWIPRYNARSRLEIAIRSVSGTALVALATGLRLGGLALFGCALWRLGGIAAESEHWWGPSLVPLAAIIVAGVLHEAIRPLANWLGDVGLRVGMPPLSKAEVYGLRGPRVVLLRSFGDDERSLEDSGGHGVKAFLKRVSGLAFRPERLFMEPLYTIGIPVAVGRPRERRSPSGALRFYLADDEWKEEVDALIHHSYLTLLWIGASAGVQWELERALAHKSGWRRCQLILFFRAGGDDWRARVKEGCAQLGQALQRDVEVPDARSFFVCFDRDEKPIVVTGDLQQTENARLAAAFGRCVSVLREVVILSLDLYPRDFIMPWPLRMEWYGIAIGRWVFRGVIVAYVAGMAWLVVRALAAFL